MCVRASSWAGSSCEHKCSQPATTAGRAEARSPGLPVLGSPGGQKALEPLSQRRSGRGIRKSVAAPNTKKKRKEQQETRERGKQRASGQPNPETQERPHKGGARPQKKTGATRQPQKRKADFSQPRQNTAKFERKSGTQTQKKKHALPEGKKPTVSCVETWAWFSLTEKKKKTPQGTYLQAKPISWRATLDPSSTFFPGKPYSTLQHLTIPEKTKGWRGPWDTPKN